MSTTTPTIGYTIVADAAFGDDVESVISFLAVTQEKFTSGEESVYSMGGIYPDKMFETEQKADDFYILHAAKLERSFGVLPGSFRIVKITHEKVKDLKPADEIKDEVIKRQALAKLTEEEKDLLGLNTEN